MPKRESVQNGRIYLARQPIYGPRRDIRGYELLYRRAAPDATARIRNPDGASAQVALQAAMEIALLAVSPERPAFVNHTQRLLMTDPILPPDRCIVEVLEDVAMDAETVEALRRLKKSGYRIALDDFVYSVQAGPLVELADFIKLDYRALGAEGCAAQIALVRGSGALLLAEKIETEGEFDCCRELGCHLFQGHYLRKPETLAGRRIPSNRLTVLSLLAECVNPDCSANMAGVIIERDALLTYGLLRMASSAMFFPGREIRNAAHAVALLGIDRVFRWATLLVLAGNDDCPAGYLEAAIQRARMSELIAPYYDCVTSEAYLTGLLSTLDSVLNAPLAELIEFLSIDDRYKRALIAREGSLGALLKAVIAYEEGSWADEEDAGRMTHSYWEAVRYAGSMMQLMAGGASAM